MSYKAYILKFIEQAVKAKELDEEEFRTQLLSNLKTMLASINMVQQRNLVELITTNYLDGILDIESSSFQSKLSTISESSDTKCASDDANTVICPTDIRDLLTKPNEIIYVNKLESSDTKKKTSSDLLDDDLVRATNSNIKELLTFHKERSSTTQLKIDTFLEEDLEMSMTNSTSDVSPCICYCRIRAVSSHGRPLKYNVNYTTPEHFYKDKDGYYYGNQCENKAMPGELYCSQHRKAYEEGTIDLVSEPPRCFENKDAANDTITEWLDTTSLPTTKKINLDTADEDLSDNIIPEGFILHKSGDNVCLLKVDTGGIYDINTLEYLGDNECESPMFSETEDF